MLSTHCYSISVTAVVTPSKATRSIQYSIGWTAGCDEHNNYTQELHSALNTTIRGDRQ